MHIAGGEVVLITWGLEKQLKIQKQRVATNRGRVKCKHILSMKEQHGSCRWEQITVIFRSETATFRLFYHMGKNSCLLLYLLIIHQP